MNGSSNSSHAVQHVSLDRRKGRDDFWVSALRVAGMLAYPLLFINLAIFVAVSGLDQQADIQEQFLQSAEERVQEEGLRPNGTAAPSGMDQQSAVERISSWVHLHTFMPIMSAGLVIGIVGWILSFRRSRRHYDINFKYPMGFTVVSVIGLVLYFIFRG